MRALVPFSGIGGLRSELDRLFDRFFEGQAFDAQAVGDWVPAVDVVENKDKVTVKTELPGVDPKDVEVSVQDSTLVIRGEKKQEKEDKDEHSYRLERSYGAFMRAVKLPASVDASKVEAKCKNGVVTITLPKSERAKGVTVPVKAA